MAVEFFEDTALNRERFSAKFDGGDAHVFKSQYAEAWLGSVTWSMLGASINVDTNIEPLGRITTREQAIQWCHEMIETGPELVLEALRGRLTR